MPSVYRITHVHFCIYHGHQERKLWTKLNKQTKKKKPLKTKMFFKFNIHELDH